MKKVTLITCLILINLLYSNAQGLKWATCYGGTSQDKAYNIQQTTDGGYIVVGSTSSNNGDVTGNHGETDYWVIRVNNLGNIEWQKCLGGTGDDRASSIQQTIDGGFIIAGNTNSNDGDVTGNHGETDYWVVKLNNFGNIEWQKCLGGS